MFDEGPKAVAVSNDEHGVSRMKIGNDVVVPIGQHALDDVGQTFRGGKDIGGK
ncbi:unannotated protein [freshwater metagenome]|uniref:Unannotated protein n=1 Tax=freshwater metagenome TaxID=449393 RepID=A0A6J7N989_9ZZZZ